LRTGLGDASAQGFVARLDAANLLQSDPGITALLIARWVAILCGTGGNGGNRGVFDVSMGEGSIDGLHHLDCFWLT
jgi:hypothetical protein